jgi:sugar O-acyltransferase (sialic acid O-acetyltransferase NeuD family)
MTCHFGIHEYKKRINMKIAIIGAAQLGKLIALHANEIREIEIVGYYDDYNAYPSFNNYPILGKTSDILEDYRLNKFEKLLIGIGYNHMEARSTIFSNFKNKIPFANLIHPSCYLDKTSILGEGILLFPRVTIDLNVIIGDNVLINTGSIISHHSKIGMNTFIGPGVHVAGLVNIGNSCFIGIGSTLKDCIKIGNNSVIGAGTVVLKDTPENSVSIGVPSRVIKYNNK